MRHLSAVLRGGKARRQAEIWGDNCLLTIDRDGKELVPCRFDDLYEIGNTDRLYFVHEGGWEKGHYAVFDVKEQEIILELDFDYDIGYMFNECFVADNDILVFDEHLPGEGKDLITAYDLHQKKYLPKCFLLKMSKNASNGKDS